MGFFSSIKNINEIKELKDKKIESYLIPTPINSSNIGASIEINGDLYSNEPIVINGVVKGNIKSSSIVIVLKNGVINGNIEANEVRNDGKIFGYIKAQDIIEITKGAFQEGYMIASCIVNNGYCDGDIIAKKKLNIRQYGTVYAHIIKAGEIVCNGKVKSNIKTYLLTILKEGLIEGKVVTNSIIIKKGGFIKGDIITNNSKNMNNQNKNKNNDLNIAK